MGHRQKPSAAKRANGSAAQHPERVNAREPVPPAGIPDPPFDMPERATQAWCRICDILSKMDLLSLAESEVLELYCRAYALWQEATEKCEIEGYVLQHLSGRGYRNPWDAIRERASTQMTKLLIELGLTPAARTKVNTLAPVKGTDDWREWLKVTG